MDRPRPSWSRASLALVALDGVPAVGTAQLSTRCCRSTFFRDRRFSIGSGVVTVAFFVMFGFFFLATQYLQFGRGYSPLEAGLALLPLPIIVRRAVASQRRHWRPASARPCDGGRARDRRGRLRDPEPAHADDAVRSWLAAAFAVLGAGMGMTAAPATGEIMSAVPLSKAGVGSAVNDTTRELGGALGIAILGSIANSAYRAAIDLSGLGLAAGRAAQGEDSIGTAARVAARCRAAASSRPGPPLPSPTPSTWPASSRIGIVVAAGGRVVSVLLPGTRRRRRSRSTSGSDDARASSSRWFPSAPASTAE